MSIRVLPIHTLQVCACQNVPMFVTAQKSEVDTPPSPVLVQTDCTWQGSKNEYVQLGMYTPTILKKKIMFLWDLGSPHCEELSFIPAYTFFNQSNGQLTPHTTGIQFPSWDICSSTQA